MNKILTGLFALGLSLVLASCGGGAEPTSTPSSSQGGGEDKVLADTEHAGWCLHGPFLLADGETVNGWNKKSKALYEASMMTATSIADVKKIDAEVGAKLAAKQVKYLYKYEGAIFGKNDGGYTKDFRDAEGNLKVANASYTFKGAQLDYDEDDQVYSESQWMMHDHDGPAESLDGNLFLPPFAEEPDEAGFSWASDQVVRSGAGVYTVIIAEYAGGNYSATNPRFGFALKKTADVEGGIDYENPPEATTYSLIGVYGGHEWNYDTELTPNADESVWTLDIELAANDAVKVRKNHAWSVSFGYGDLADGHEATLEDAEGNVKIATAGKYHIVLTVANEKPLQMTLAVA